MGILQKYTLQGVQYLDCYFCGEQVIASRYTLHKRNACEFSQQGIRRTRKALKNFKPKQKRFETVRKLLGGLF